MDKKAVVDHKMEHYTDVKRKEILTFVDGPGDYNAKWNKSKKDIHHMISLICGI